jgi:hypothetical protein
MIEDESAGALTGHPMEGKERVVGQYLVIITGYPNGDEEKIKEAITRMIAGSLIDNRSELGKLVGSLHTVVGVFDPQEYFGAC